MKRVPEYLETIKKWDNVYNFRQSTGPCPQSDQAATYLQVFGCTFFCSMFSSVVIVVDDG